MEQQKILKKRSRDAKKEPEVLKYLAPTKKTKSVSKKAVPVRDIRDIETGYFRRDQMPSANMLKRYDTLVEIQLERLRVAYASHTSHESYDATQKISHGMLKAKAKQHIVENAFERTRAPFGRQRGFCYHYDSTTGIVQYAGSVYTLQAPTKTIRSSDLLAQAKVRFEKGKRVLTFTLKIKPKNVEELHNAINRQSFSQGVSADGNKNRVYKAKRRSEYGEKKRQMK